MYEELVKRLREAPNDWPDADLHYEAADAIEELSKQIEAVQCVNIGDMDCDSNQLCTCMGIVRKRLEELEEDTKRPRWIPVTERLPDGEVLALNNLKGSYGYHEYLIGYVGKDNDSDSGFLCESESVILTNVTHWMPLPEPPKEER